MAGPRRLSFAPRFFLDTEPGVGDEVELPADDSRHAARALRVRPGDPVELVTAAGRVYDASVLSGSEPVRVRLEEEKKGFAAGGSYRSRVGLVQALARPAAVDLVIEKGTEVGSSFFMLVQAAGSPTAGRDLGARAARWRRIAREAAKQSKQTAVPSIDAGGGIEECLRRLGAEEIESVALTPTAEDSLGDVLREMSDLGRGGLALWIGPEGGWTAEELDTFAMAGTRLARLGRSVLRTETAGPVAVALARLVLGDW